MKCAIANFMYINMLIPRAVIKYPGNEMPNICTSITVLFKLKSIYSGFYISFYCYKIILGIEQHKE